MQKDTFEIEKFPDLSEFSNKDSGAKLRVCIATEEILGPVRNGGIASTYYHLARGLASQGHEVTIVLLKGSKVQQYTPEYWVEHYAEFAVKLVYLEWPNESFVHVSHPWQGRCLAFYNWLKNYDFDVVHTSEWRGGAYYALAAKRLGLAFQRTLFLVKASSPFIWNRHYQMQPIEMHNLFSVSFLEQKCIEWADVIIGGSAHLLSFMDHIGYNMPIGGTYVQPNIVDFSELKISDSRKKSQYGDLVKSKKLVFFGRLESRKGLENFCRALDICVRAGDCPEHVTFLGKQGVLSSEKDFAQPIDYILAKAKDWPFEIDIITDRGQPEALTYLCSDEFIAVMPSLIENSTMTVYEALVHRIPFIATDVGGTAELIAEDSKQYALVEPTVSSLVTRLKDVLDKGQFISYPAFDNGENVQVWYNFHHYLAKQFSTQADVTWQNALVAKRIKAQVKHLSLVVANEGSISSENWAVAQFDKVIICDLTGQLTTGKQSWPSNFEVLDCYGVPKGEAFNFAITEHVKDAFIVASEPPKCIAEKAGDILKTALSESPESILTSFFRVPIDTNNELGKLVTPLGGDIGHQVIDDRVYGAEFMALRKDCYKRVGQFENYDIADGVIHEFVSRALLTDLDFFVIPEVLFESVKGATHNLSVDKSYKYLKVKAAIDSLPLQLKKLVLFAASEQGAKALVNIDIYNKQKE